MSFRHGLDHLCPTEAVKTCCGAYTLCFPIDSRFTVTIDCEVGSYKTKTLSSSRSSKRVSFALLSAGLELSSTTVGNSFEIVNTPYARGNKNTQTISRTKAGI